MSLAVNSVSSDKMYKSSPTHNDFMNERMSKNIAKLASQDRKNHSPGTISYFIRLSI